MPGRRQRGGDDRGAGVGDVMPLLDHFRPPLSVLQRPWEGVHGSWAAAIATKLSEQLPPDFFAMPLVSVGGQVEVDVGREDGRAKAARSHRTGQSVQQVPPKSP